MIVPAIKKAFETARRLGWEKTYWAFDIHETMLKPNWIARNIPTEFYPDAKEALRLLSDREDIVMFLYTCSHPHDTDEYIRLFEDNDIYFNYVNENPEVVNSDLGYYDKKPYFNVLLDDKAGFDPYVEWPAILKWIKEDGQ